MIEHGHDIFGTRENENVDSSASQYCGNSLSIQQLADIGIGFATQSRGCSGRSLMRSPSLTGQGRRESRIRVRPRLHALNWTRLSTDAYELLWTTLGTSTRKLNNLNRSNHAITRTAK